MKGSKALALAAVLSLLVAALFGWRMLTRETTKVTPPPAPTPGTAPIHITFWHSMSADSRHGKIVADLIRQFNQEHKEIQVDALYQGSYSDLQRKTLSALSIGNAPTIIQATDSMLFDLISDGIARPIDNLVPAAELADYPAPLLEQVTYQGQHYALPFNRSALVLFYNTRLVPQAPATWEEFRSVAADLTDDETAGTAFSADVYAFTPFFLGAGGQWLEDGRLAVDGQAGVDALTTMKAMIDDGSAVMLKPMEYQSDFMSQGKAAMVVSTTASMAYMHNINGDPIAMAPVPAGPDGEIRTVSNGANAVILAAAKPAEAKAAATFLLWLTGRNGTLALATGDTGYGPVRLSALNDPLWQSYLRTRPDAAVLATEFAHAVPMPMTRDWSRVQTIMTQAVRDALTGDADPEDALVGAVMNAQPILKQQ